MIEALAETHVTPGGPPALPTPSGWQIAPLRCYELGLRLKGAAEPPASAPLASTPAEALLAEITAAAICHSTNWDRLRTVISARADTGLFASPARLASMSLSDFQHLFGDAFSASNGIRARHAILIDTASRIEQRRPFALEELLDGSVTLSGSLGLYELLAQLPAFGRDPEAKKARVLVQELCRGRLISPTDPETVRPAIEYHLIRLYLRTERVLPPDHNDERLQEGATFRAPMIMSLRRAVEEAMFITATAADLPIYHVNQLEWQIARSFCERRGPRCAGPPRPDKPCDASVMELCEGVACPFVSICDARNNPRLSSLVEPQLSSRYDFY